MRRLACAFIDALLIQAALAAGNACIVEGNDYHVMPYLKEGWMGAFPDCFPYLVGIHRMAGGPRICNGLLITTRHVLTAAHCFQGKIIENIIVAVEPQGRSKEVRSYRVHIHPGWNGDFDFGYDAAIVELPQSFGCDCSSGAFPNVAHIPPLADPNIDIYPNMRLYAFASDANNSLITAQFVVISKDNCSNRTELWGNKLLCVHSPSAGVFGGMSGGPLMLYGHRTVQNAVERQPDLDVAAALAVVSSFDTHSPKGTMSVILIASLHDWVREVVAPERLEVWKSGKIGFLGWHGGTVAMLVALAAILLAIVQILGLVVSIPPWARIAIFTSVIWLVALAHLGLLSNGFYAVLGLHHRNPLP